MSPFYKSLPLLICAIASLTSLSAKADGKQFIAPGLWRIASHIYGPLGAVHVLTQDECWDKNGRSSQGTYLLMPSPSASQVNLTYKISTSGLTSTVHTHAEFPGPHLRGALDTLMIFSAIGDAMHTATMKGTASVTYEGKNAILDVHATQTGYLISSTCPLMLPPSKMETLKPSHLPALDALQKLAKQLQAEDPHPNSP